MIALFVVVIVVVVVVVIVVVVAATVSLVGISGPIRHPNPIIVVDRHGGRLPDVLLAFVSTTLAGTTFISFPRSVSVPAFFVFVSHVFVGIGAIEQRDGRMTSAATSCFLSGGAIVIVVVVMMNSFGFHAGEGDARPEIVEAFPSTHGHDDFVSRGDVYAEVFAYGGEGEAYSFLFGFGVRVLGKGTVWWLWSWLRSCLCLCL